MPLDGSRPRHQKRTLTRSKGGDRPPSKGGHCRRIRGHVGLQAGVALLGGLSAPPPYLRSLSEVVNLLGQEEALVEPPLGAYLNREGLDRR
jgi:hypothetical protein